MTSARADVALRAYADEDFALLRALLGDPAMTGFLGGPESESALRSRHERYLAADPVTNGLYAVVVGRTRTPAGWAGFWESEWRGDVAWECGWHVLPPFQHQGVASAAGILLLDEARSRARHRFIDAFPARDNLASNAVCCRLGFLSLGDVEVEYPKGTMMQAVQWRFDLAAPR